MRLPVGRPVGQAVRSCEREKGPVHEGRVEVQDDEVVDVKRLMILVGGLGRRRAWLGRDGPTPTPGGSALGLPMPVVVTLGALIGLALLSTALAYGIYLRLLATSDATNLLLVTFLIPMSALLLGTLFLGERLALGAVAGMAAIGLRLVAIDGRLLRRLCARDLTASA